MGGSSSEKLENADIELEPAQVETMEYILSPPGFHTPLASY